MPRAGTAPHLHDRHRHGHPPAAVERPPGPVWCRSERDGDLGSGNSIGVPVRPEVAENDPVDGSSESGPGSVCVAVHVRHVPSASVSSTGPVPLSPSRSGRSPSSWPELRGPDGSSSQSDIRQVPGGAEGQGFPLGPPEATPLQERCNASFGKARASTAHLLAELLAQSDHDPLGPSEYGFSSMARGPPWQSKRWWCLQ